LPLSLTTFQWVELFFASGLLGFSKSGVPGTGILAVPILASVFGARLSVGTAIVILIFADIFAVRFYWKATDWKQLKRLLPSVVLGFILGAVGLFVVPKSERDLLNPIIGGVVLIMLGLSLLRGKLGDKLVPTSPTGVQFTGAMAGFTTMVSNAAGPIMQIYLAATKMSKEAMLGTSAVYFFAVNTAKIPFYFGLSYTRPDAPMWTLASCGTAVLSYPAVLVGTWLGRRAQKKIPEQAFKNAVLVLAAFAAVKMIAFA
jgi:uncharacterized protein